MAISFSVWIGLDLVTKLLSGTAQASLDGALAEPLRRRDVGDGASFDVERLEQAMLRERESRERSRNKRPSILAVVAFLGRQVFQHGLVERFRAAATKVIGEDVP
jgi:hypothetical protein